MVTISDVAKKAGVSRSTVSLVINHSPKVKDETKEKVQDAIEQLDFVPNTSARSLGARRTNNIGIVVFIDKDRKPDEFSYDFGQASGLCSYNISNGIMLRLMQSDYGIVSERFCSIEHPDELPLVIRDRRVDGAVFVGNPYSPALIKNMKETGIPFVLTGIDSYDEVIDSVYANPGAGAVMQLDYLLRMGHKKICLVNGPQFFHSSYNRVKSIRDYCVDKNIDFDFDWCISCQSNRGTCGYDSFKEFWEAGSRPDAVITANGRIALGVMRFLYEQKIRIPEDISIIAYEDSALCGYATPGLTAVNIKKEVMGERAASCLIERLKNPDAKVKKIEIEPYMVERESVMDMKKK